MAMTYTISFKSKSSYSHAKEIDDNDQDGDGPIVERRCPQCQNEKMSYATLQLRSADEGQTVFYTCTKCKYVRYDKYMTYVLISLKVNSINDKL